MKWQPLFAHLLKLFIRTEKVKNEDSDTTTLIVGDGQPNVPTKAFDGKKTYMTNNERSS